MALYIGTSGWAYREWKPGFYPEDLPHRRWLEHYSSRLGACEINATFYRLQSEATFNNLVSTAPGDFRFVVKAHRRLTHGKKLASPKDGFLKEFFDSLAPLAGRVPAILFQLPPYRERDDDALTALVGALPSGRSYAFEFRHESWADPAVARSLAAMNATVCIADTSGDPPAELPPGPLAYVRLRNGVYSDAQRAAWMDLLVRESRERDVYAFVKHEDGEPAGFSDRGVGLAEWLANATRDPRRDVTDPSLIDLR